MSNLNLSSNKPKPEHKDRAERSRKATSHTITKTYLKSSTGKMPQPRSQAKPVPNTNLTPEPGSDLDSDSDSDTSPAIPLEKQAVFGAGLKRKRITFVPAGTLRAETDTQSGLPPTSQAKSAQTYWSIVSGSQTQGTQRVEDREKGGAEVKPGSTSERKVESGSGAGLYSSLPHAEEEGDGQQPSGQGSEGSATEWTTDDEHERDNEHEKDEICPVCHLPLHLTTHPPPSSATAQGDELSSSAHSTRHRHTHESLLAHQVSLPHIHPPSALDRRRMGVQYLKVWGWDVDSRTGLGKLGTGRRDIVRVVNKQDTLGLGVELGKGGKAVVRKPTLNAKQARVKAVRDRRRADELRAKMFGREDEVQKILNGA